MYLNGADLSNADLSGSNLSGAILSNTNLVGANFYKANLSGADFYRSNLRGVTSLSNKNLTNVKMMNCADLSKADLSGTDLGGVDLSGARLVEADLSGASLFETNLKGANLTTANVSNARIGLTHFIDTNLSEVNGLESCDYIASSIIDYLTLERSGLLPTVFLRGCGLPDPLIDYYPSLLTQSISYYSCFISYSHEDKVFARRLHDALQGRGIRCWLDEHQLLPGDDIYEQVDRGIKLWDKVLLCASKSALTSWWVDNEIDSAFKKEQTLFKKRGEKVWSLIPLDLDGYIFNDEWSNGKAGQVKSRLTADFKGWKTDNELFETALEKIVKALQVDETGREVPPPSKL